MGKFDTFEKLNWCGYEWIKQPLWGVNHQDEDLSWYDTDCVNVDNNGNIILTIKRNPRVFEEDGEKITKEFTKAYVRTIEEFKYGTFEWEMKVPGGKYIWPALWFASDYSWPPEIDCMEGWSDNNINYVKMLLWRNIKPTMHWSKNCDTSDSKNHISERKNNVLRFWLKCNDFDKYKVVWTPAYIDVYYNKHMIKRFDDPEMLQHFNKPEVRLHPIMSLNMYDKFPEYYDYYCKLNKPMIIRNFKYNPLNNK